ncbi:hypothetical protein G3I67_09570 [Orrella sp. NBD-18]|uniref:Glycosyltransferase RgtA/B/C/D-like domain-containing protein n=1 Tax=Sheuella amnicola TaxID=2707330 RepID=A0A6B2R297_9BURK|nr:hypothetical protein [Sheuella amnicola]NDY83479.1 hypothetical protein [Sheuella amnicola]
MNIKKNKLNDISSFLIKERTRRNRLIYTWCTNSILFIISVALLALYIPYAKPIWIDEFLHFALGGFESTVEVLKVIDKTTKTFNHGQTGFYMLIDYYLLKIFGANAFAMRLPSLISGCLLIIAGIIFLRAKKIGLIGQIAYVVALFGQVNLMNYIGEARPYMPLASSVVGVLAYYSITEDNRDKAIVNILGWSSVLWGALMHPYFILYWFAVCIFSIWSKWFNNQKRLKMKELANLINVQLACTVLVLTIGLGSLTWLRTRTEIFKFDPFQWITQTLWVEFTAFSHFAFISNARIYISLAVFCPLIYVILPRKNKINIKEFVEPSIMIIGALIISSLLAFISYTQSYWILPRQWIASQAIVVLGYAWIVGIVMKKVEKINKIISVVSGLLIMGYLMAEVEPKVKIKVIEKIEDIKKNKLFENNEAINKKNITIPTSNDEWVMLARKNIKQGGVVWPVFRSYYEITK